MSTGHSKPKTSSMSKKFQRTIKIWKDKEDSIVEDTIEGSFKDSLVFLFYESSWYLLYPKSGEESNNIDISKPGDEFDLLDESKETENQVKVLSNLLMEQERYMEYFKSLAELNSDGVKKSFDDLRNFFKKLEGTKVEINPNQREIINLLNSPDSLQILNQLQDRIRCVNKTEVSD